MQAINLYRRVGGCIRYPVVEQLPQVILCDDVVAPILDQWRWNLSKTGYAQRTEQVQGKSVAILFHLEVMRLMGVPKPDDFVDAQGKLQKYSCDHLNRVKLDCQYHNLRWATGLQQATNQKKRKSVYGLPKGVSRSRDKFQAQIGIDHKDVYLGTFDTIEQAAECYRLKWLEIHPGEVFVP